MGIATETTQKVFIDKEILTEKEPIWKYGKK